jgi:hypothetical protein
MIILPPIPIPVSAFISSNAVISIYPAWSSATAYTTGQRVFYQAPGSMYPMDYEALRNNTNVPPGSSALDWLAIGASNRYALFDERIGNSTVAPSMTALDMTVRPGQVVNGIAFFDLVGTSVRVRIIDPVEGTVYDRTVPLVDNTNITSWAAWAFEPIATLSDVTLTGLPNYGSADIRIEVEPQNGMAAIGEAVIGLQRTLGAANFGTSFSIQSYSRKERDQFGNVSVVARRSTKLVDIDVTYDTRTGAALQRALQEIESVPTVFIGEGTFAETVVYGFYRQWRAVIDTPTISSATIEIEGLV